MLLPKCDTAASEETLSWLSGNHCEANLASAAGTILKLSARVMMERPQHFTVQASIPQHSTQEEAASFSRLMQEAKDDLLQVFEAE